MKRCLLTAVAMTVLLAGGTAYAADAATAAPAPATKSMSATTPAAVPMKAAKPAMHKRASACTVSIDKTHRALRASKASSEDIAMAWQHMNAAKAAREGHDAKACESESAAALKLLDGKM